MIQEGDIVAVATREGTFRYGTVVHTESDGDHIALYFHGEKANKKIFGLARQQAGREVDTMESA